MHIVMTSAARMPASCRGRYRNVAVVRLEENYSGTPAMISERAHGVAEVVEHYGPQHVGLTERCAYERTLREAERLAAELNK